MGLCRGVGGVGEAPDFGGPAIRVSSSSSPPCSLQRERGGGGWYLRIFGDLAHLVACHVECLAHAVGRLDEGGGGVCGGGWEREEFLNEVGEGGKGEEER